MKNWIIIWRYLTGCNQAMKKVQILILIIIFLVPISVTHVYAQSLYVDAKVGDMDEIEDSKYKASGLTVVRDENGSLISVVRVDASRYFNDPIVDQFLESDPEYLIKQGMIGEDKISLYRIEVGYYTPDCLIEVMNVPGQYDPCNWYDRAFVTMLQINAPDGEEYFGFKGLNHGYSVKTKFDIITTWNILTKE